MKTRLKQKITSILGILFLSFALLITVLSYFENGNIDYQNAMMTGGVGIFLLFAEDELINQLTLGILKKFLNVKSEKEKV